MIQQKIKNLIQKVSKLSGFDISINQFEVEHPKKNHSHGDYATNVAIIIAKITKKNPIYIAELLSSKLKIYNLIFEKIEIKKPGFINFFLSKKFFIKELKKILKEKDRYGSNKISGKRKTMIIDYSSPNIAKPFGIGHLRSTIIGQAIYNIYKFLGWKCIGDNHLGDWGTQFGKLITAIKKWGDIKNLKNLSVKDLEKLYVKFHQEVKTNIQLEEEAREWFKKLENKNKEAEEIWQICVNISLKEFNRIYKLLGIKFDYILGESFYENNLQDIIKEALKKKIAVKSEGALIIKYPKNELPPAIILKSNNTTTYFTRDLATIKYRLKKWKPDLIIYEIGADQTLYLKQLFQAVELFKWAKKEKFFHVSHGLIRLKQGKFSTRKGLTIYLEDILLEAIKKANEIIEKSETKKELSEKEKKQIAKIIGIGAIKYNDLSQHYSKDIIFDWNKILNLRGNSAPYLQYTYARCKNILKKTEITKIRIISERIKNINFKNEEISILKTIYKFPEVIQEAAEKFSPNLICNFIFDIAQKYNLFYDTCPIIKVANKDVKIFRLAITLSVSHILKNGLNLMGISVLEKM